MRKKGIALLFRNAADRALLSSALGEMGLRALCPQGPFDLEGIGAVLVEEGLARALEEEIRSWKAEAAARFSFLPVIVFVSQAASPGRWLSAGFDDVLAMPVSRDLLKIRVESWLRLAEETTGRFRDLVESSAVGFYRTTPEGRIVYANPALVKLLGFSSFSELAERDLEKEGFAPESPRSRFKEFLENHGVVSAFESVWLKKDGEKVFVLESARVVRDAAGRTVYYEGTVQDITPLRRHQERLLRIGAFGRRLVLARSVKEVAQAVVEAARDILGMEDCGIFLIDGEEVVLVAHSLEPPPGPSSFPLRSERGIVAAVARTGEAVSLPDVRRDPRFIPGTRPSLSELCVPLKVGGRVIGALNLQSPELEAFGPEEMSLAEALADVAAIAMENARLFSEVKGAQEELARRAAQRKKLLDQVVAAFSAAMGLKDPYTARHQERVAKLACAIAEELGLPPERVEGLRVAALLHDVGKVLAVPGEILSKPGKLADYEMALIRPHPDVGYELLRNVEFPWPVGEIVRQHHERLDGSGYPRGLRDDEIILEARILGVADVVEAISSHRPYRPALGVERALEEIRDEGRYDREVAQACLRVFSRGFSFG